MREVSTFVQDVDVDVAMAHELIRQLEVVMGRINRRYYEHCLNSVPKVQLGLYVSVDFSTSNRDMYSQIKIGSNQYGNKVEGREFAVVMKEFLRRQGWNAAHSDPRLLTEE